MEAGDLSRISDTIPCGPDDFIVNKYRGKSGPMFNFDVHDDVRLVADATIEKDEVRCDPLSPLWLELTAPGSTVARWQSCGEELVQQIQA